MQCQMHQKNLRVFASAVQCLAKVGKEMVLSATRTNGVGSLSINAINDANTVFCTFTFYQPFFETFHLQGGGLGKMLAVKIPLKACVNALKSHRSTERLNLSFVDESDGTHLVLLVSQCKQGLRKTHQLHYEESTIFSATFDRQHCRNSFTARTSLIQNAFRNVYGAEESALAVDAGAGIRIKSHFQHATEKSQYTTLKTDIGVSVEELEEFKVDKGNDEVAFSLKEVRAMLHFCEHHDIDLVGFLFNQPGDPMLVTSELGKEDNNSQDGGPTGGHQANTFSVELIMATLETEEEEGPEAADGDALFKEAPKKQAESDSSQQSELPRPKKRQRT